MATCYVPRAEENVVQTPAERKLSSLDDVDKGDIRYNGMRGICTRLRVSNFSYSTVFATVILCFS